MEITITEAAILKAELEDAIVALLKEFQEKTDLRITDIYFDSEAFYINNGAKYVQFFARKPFSIEVAL